MRELKYLSFSTEDRDNLESSDRNNLKIQQVQIKSPDNPVKRIAARLIGYEI